MFLSYFLIVLFLVRCFSGSIFGQDPSTLSLLAPPGLAPPAAVPSSLVGAPPPGPVSPQAPFPIPLTSVAGVQPFQYANESAILGAVTEATSPVVPLFNVDPAQKSRIKIYEGIFKSLQTLFQQITYETKKRIFSGFISDVVDVALESDLVTTKLLADILNMFPGIEVDLARIRDELRRLKSTEAPLLSQSFNTIYTTLLSRKSALARRMKKLSDFLLLIDRARQIDPGKFDLKIRTYQGIILSLTKSIASEGKEELIADLGRLLAMAGTDNEQKEKVFGLLSLMEKSRYLSDQERRKIADLRKPAPSVVPAPGVAPVPPVPPTPGVPPVLAVAPLAPTITSPVPTVVPPTPGVPPVPTVAPPVSGAPPAQSRVGVGIEEIKNKLNIASKNYPELIKVCSEAVDMLVRAPDPGSKKILVTLISEKLVVLYNARGSFDNKQMASLIELFNKAGREPGFSSYVTSQIISTVKITSMLIDAVAEKNLIKKISIYQQIANAVTRATDDYEKGRFADGLMSIFNMRKEMNISEINSLKSLLSNLNAPAFKGKNVFESSVFDLIRKWLKIITGTTVLLTSKVTDPIEKQVGDYAKILDNIALPTADYERSLFMTIITQLFNFRGNFKKNEILELKNLFTKIQNKPGLLAYNQIPVMVLWINELDNASKLIVGNKIYIESLLEDAVKTRVLTKYNQILQLFNSESPTSIINSFIAALNNLFKERNLYDRDGLLKLFIATNQKKISPVAYLLGPTQKDVISEWIKVLTTEKR